MKTRLYIIRMWKCVESEIHGPYDDDDQRIEAAKKLRGDEHTVARLNIPEVGAPTVESFSGVEIDPDLDPDYEDEDEDEKRGTYPQFEGDTN